MADTNLHKKESRLASSLIALAILAMTATGLIITHAQTPEQPDALLVRERVAVSSSAASSRPSPHVLVSQADIAPPQPGIRTYLTQLLRRSLSSMQHGTAPAIGFSFSGLPGSGDSGQKVLVYAGGTLQWVPLSTFAQSPDTGRGRIPAGSDVSGSRSVGGGSASTPVPALQIHDHQSDGGGGKLDINRATFGILTPNKGGTGFDRYGTGDLLVGQSDSTLGKLIAGTPGQVLTVSGGTLAWSSTVGGNLTLGAADARYVNTSGDTMSGTLRVTTNGIGIAVAGTLSGASIHAERGVSSSGTVVAAGTIIARGGFLGTTLALTGSSSILGKVGIGTTAPKTQLEVEGTVSGSVLRASSFLASSGSLVVQSSEQFHNLVGCSAILSDAAGNLSCASGLTQPALDSRYVNTSGDTMTGGLIIRTSGLGLNVTSTISGATIFAAKGLSSSGSILTNGNLSARGTLSGASLTVMNGTSYLMGNVGIGKTSPGAKLDVAGTISGSSLTVSGLSSCAAIQSSSAGAFSCANYLSQTNLDSRYVNTSGDTMTGGLIIRTSGLGLNVTSTISGATIFAAKGLSSSGSILTNGNLSARGTLSGAALTTMNGNSYFLGKVGIGKSVTPNAKLEVVGTISGSQLVISGAASISGSTLIKGNLTTKGTLSGASLVVSGSKSCTALLTDVNGTVTCGSGFQNTVANDARYVNTSGDTMTGALVITPSGGSGSLALRIVGTTTHTGSVIIGSNAAGTKPLIVKGAVGQSANLLEWQNSTGTVQAWVDATGHFYGDGSHLTGLALDANVVHLAGAETVTGAKTFTSPLVGSLALSLANGSALAPVSVQPASAGHGPMTFDAASVLFSSTQDPVIGWGYNQNANGVLSLAAENGLRWNMEGDYDDGSGQHKMETYLQYVSADAAVLRRPIFFQINRTTNALTQSRIAGNPLYITGWDGVAEANTVYHTLAKNTNTINGIDGTTQFVAAAPAGQEAYLTLSRNAASKQLQVYTASDGQAGISFGTFTANLYNSPIGAAGAAFAVGAADNSAVGLFAVGNSNAGVKGLVARGKAGQTANLQEWQNSSSTALAFVTPSGQFNGTTDGVVTKVNAGACADGTFTTATNGTMCIDSTDGRFYFRYGGAWHYAAQTAGFQIPNIVTDAKNETEGLQPGDYVIGQLNQRLQDGALHGLYVKFDMQTEIARTLAAHPDLLTHLSQTGSTASVSASDLHDLAVQGALTVYGNASFLGDVSVKGELAVSGKQAGRAIIPRSANSVSVTFSGRFAGIPIVTAMADDFTLSRYTQLTQTGFTIQIQHPAEQDITFNWIALSTEQPTISLGTASSPTSSSVSSQSSGASGSVLASVAFPVDADGIPLSSNDIWNKCIRNQTPLDTSGHPYDCNRYHSGYVWQQPDLTIDFTYNGNHDPRILTLPAGYHAVTQVVSSSGLSGSGSVSSSSSASAQPNESGALHLPALSSGTGTALSVRLTGSGSGQ